MHTGRILAATLLAFAIATLALGQRVAPQRPREQAADEARLGQLVREWADAAVHGDLQKLDAIQADDFKGSTEGKSFDKRMLREALKSGAMKIAAWTIEDVKVSVRGNSAVVTGRSRLTNATYMGQDFFSGDYEWTDHFSGRETATGARFLHSRVG